MTSEVRISRLGQVWYRRRWWHLWTTRGSAWAVHFHDEPSWARPPVFGNRFDAEAAARRLRQKRVR